MTEFIIITANDIHISDNGPRSRIDDFKNTILGKINQMCMACNKLNADAAIIAGDLYNLKNPARNSHSLNRELVTAFRQFNCPIYMIEGNHDLTANRLESLEEQPLGVLFADETLIQLRDEVIEKEGFKISLVGVPYTEGLDLDTLVLPEKGNCISQICAMHQYTGLKGGMFFKERLYGYDELSVFSPDIYVLGHYHIDQGIHQEPNGKYFINIGSMARGALSEEDIDHHPQIGFIKITVDADDVTYTLRSINLKVKPAAEVFDLIKREQEDKEKEEIKLFVEKLATEATEETVDNSKSIDELIDSMDMAKVVRDRVLYFIQEATA